MTFRKQPTYARWHENLPTHPKTRAAAEVLAGELRLPMDYAEAVVCRGVPLLVCWLIRNQDDGRTSRLTDGELASIFWPAGTQPGGALWGAEADELAVVRRALRARPDGYRCGFLELRGQGKGKPRVEALHEFIAYAWAALRNRPHYKGTALEDWERGAEEPEGDRGEPVENRGPGGGGGPPSASSDPVPGLFPTSSSDPSSDVSTPGPRLGIASDGALGERAGSAPIHPSPVRMKGRESPAGGLARGWKGIPDGVRRGELPAVAAFLRGLPPISRLDLREGTAYLERYREAMEAPLPPEALSVPAIQPARLFETLEPEAFAALVSDLAPRIGQAEHPVSYAARALASRWTETLAKLDDEAQKRRSRRFREERTG